MNPAQGIFFSSTRPIAVFIVELFLTTSIIGGEEFYISEPRTLITINGNSFENMKNMLSFMPSRNLATNEYVAIQFISFDVKGEMPLCHEDFVHIFLRENYVDVGKYCSNNLEVHHFKQLQFITHDGFARIQYSIKNKASSFNISAQILTHSNFSFTAEQNDDLMHSWKSNFFAPGWPMKLMEKTETVFVRNDYHHVSRLIFFDMRVCKCECTIEGTASAFKLYESYSEANWSRGQIENATFRNVQERKLCDLKSRGFLDSNFFDLVVTYRSYWNCSGLAMGIVKYNQRNDMKTQVFPSSTGNLTLVISLICVALLLFTISTVLYVKYERNKSKRWRRKLREKGERDGIQYDAWMHNFDPDGFVDMDAVSYHRLKSEASMATSSMLNNSSSVKLTTPGDDVPTQVTVPAVKFSIGEESCIAASDSSDAEEIRFSN